MNEKIKININKKKVLENSSENSRANLIVLLLILKHTVKGKTKSISFNKLAYVFDAICKNRKESKGTVLLSSPWQISMSLKKMIILACENALIDIVRNGSSVKFTIGNKGLELLDKIEKESLFGDLDTLIRFVSENVSESDLCKQKR